MSSPPPPAVEELTLVALDYVHRALAFNLDFSPETLSVLDHYAASVRGDLARNPALAAVLAPALGAYFGEVVRAHLHGFWRIPSANHTDWALCSSVAFLAMNPVAVAYDAIHGSTEHGGPRSILHVSLEDRTYVDQRLSTLPPVPEDEFFSFSTRYEVFEVVTEALTAKMQEEGYGGTEYSAEDYGMQYD